MSPEPPKPAVSSKDSEISVRVTPDKVQAFLKITAPTGEGKEVIFEDILQILKNSSVVHGIDEAVIKDTILFRKFDNEVLIARGTPAENGKDGYVKYFYEPKHSVKPKEDNKGNVSYHDIGLIRSVKKGTPLAQIFSPLPGTPGKSVTGENLNPVEGKTVNLPAGQNTVTHPENPDILIAGIDGALGFRPGPIIDMEPIYTVKGDIDFSTGNIECVGSLYIHGDIKSDFKIKAGGDLDVKGVVEDAEIEAEGQIVLQTGIVGRGKGIVKAGGNIYLKYCENQTIYSKGDVVAGEALLHSHVIADGMVQVLGKKGVIIGGEIFAARGVDVQNLGNYQNTRTDITVGIHKETQAKLEENEAAVKKGTENLENVKNAVRSLAVMKAGIKVWPPDKEAMLQKLRLAMDSLQENLKTLNDQKTELDKEFDKYKSATVKVKQKIYPGVRIRIQREVITVNEERSNICYYLDGLVMATRAY